LAEQLVHQLVEMMVLPLAELLVDVKVVLMVALLAVSWEAC